MSEDQREEIEAARLVAQAELLRLAREQRIEIDDAGMAIFDAAFLRGAASLPRPSRTSFSQFGSEAWKAWVAGLATSVATAVTKWSEGGFGSAGFEVALADVIQVLGFGVAAFVVTWLKSNGPKSGR